MYMSNIWLVTKESFNNFVTSTRGKVIYVAEEGDSMILMHPAILSSGALLPPIDSIQLALDDRLNESAAVYENYLLTSADPYVSVILAAAIQQTPVGIMFGDDELNQAFPTMFLNFLYKYYGIVVGISEKGVSSYIEDNAMPFCLAKLYNQNIIDYKTFMERHPNLPIDDRVISKLAYEVNPPVEVKDFYHYKEYFERIKNRICENGNKFLIDPFVSV